MNQESVDILIVNGYLKDADNKYNILIPLDVQNIISLYYIDIRKTTQLKPWASL